MDKEKCSWFSPLLTSEKYKFQSPWNFFQYLPPACPHTISALIWSKKGIPHLTPHPYSPLQLTMFFWHDFVHHYSSKHIWVNYVLIKQEFSELTGKELASYLRQWPFLVYLVCLFVSLHFTNKLNDKLMWICFDWKYLLKILRLKLFLFTESAKQILYYSLRENSGR